MKQLVLNKAAVTEVFGAAQRVRVRTQDMGSYLELQVRPTDRASAVNLPKGETLVDLTGNGTTIELPDDAVSALPTNATFMVLQARKHGWLALVNAVATSEDSPGSGIR